MLVETVVKPTRTSFAAAKPPRLALRFAIYTGIALVVVAIAMLWVLERDVETRAEQRAVAQTQQVAEANLRRHLRGSDFARSVDVKRRQMLDTVFDDIVVGGFVRATLFSSTGRVTYSTDHSLIGGTGGPSDSFQSVLSGEPSRSEEFLGETKVLRTFVPVRLVAGGRPIGALSLTQDYRAIDVQVVEAFRHTAVILFIALLALWGSLIPILRRATAQLHERNRQLVTQARELEDALLERRRAEETVVQLAAIVESSHDAIAGMGTSGEILSWNAGAERLFGYTAEEMIGRPVAALVPAERQHELTTVARRLKAGEGVEEHQSRGLRKDGTEVDVSLTVSPIRDSLRRVTGAAVIARDITQTRRQQSQLQNLLAKERVARADAEDAQQALSEQNERLRELDRLKDEFISLVSHELRTPLTSIRGYLELLLDGGAGELSDDQSRFLAVVDRNSKRLMHLVGDLLFLAQVEAGKLALELGEVELDDIVAESVEAAKPIADEKGIELRASLASIPKMVGDRGRLAQVLDNLVSNALKFTTEGGTVDVRVSAQNGDALIEVVDTGIGIAPPEQALLFDRFFRSSEATQRAIPGTGLGLTIVKAIVVRHGGGIDVESSEGRGTTMRIRLPIREPQRVHEEVAV
ncbi:MAG TPA: ATP-binding protein [Gaiellaceae bacterium]|jgi:PAS domain S-box-containing protein|nr:ATP-binding protein [Gaiellaceae bacterium]